MTITILCITPLLNTAIIHSRHNHLSMIATHMFIYNNFLTEKPFEAHLEVRYSGDFHVGLGGSVTAITQRAEELKHFASHIERVNLVPVDLVGVVWQARSSLVTGLFDDTFRQGRRNGVLNAGGIISNGLPVTALVLRACEAVFFFLFNFV